MIAAEDGADAVMLANAVRARAEEVAQFWLGGAHAAYGQAKRLVRSKSTFTEQLADEARTIGAMYDTDDARARVTAFAQASARKTD